MNDCFCFLLKIFQDFIYHLAAGVALIIVGTFPIAFGVLSINKYLCSSDEESSQQHCTEFRKKVMEPEFQLAAGVRYI